MANQSSFIVALLLLGIVSMPVVTDAQQPKGKTAWIGYMSSRAGPSHLEEAFRRELRDLGYVEGQDISIEYRWAAGNLDRLPVLAADLVRLKVDVIVSTGGAIPALAAKKATKTIPIVFSAVDPVAAGLVARIDRPGENVTGIDILSRELNVKRLELLKGAVPDVSRIAALARPPTTARGRALLKDLESAARGLRVKLQIVEAQDRQEIDGGFTAMARERVEALLVVTDPLFMDERARVVNLAAKHRLPGAFPYREYAEAGGLLSYGTNLVDVYRRLATYVDKILKGAKPGDLPVEQPTKVRTGGQSQDGENARHHDSQVLSRPRGPHHRSMTSRIAISGWSPSFARSERSDPCSSW